MDRGKSAASGGAASAKRRKWWWRGIALFTVLALVGLALGDPPTDAEQGAEPSVAVQAQTADEDSAEPPVTTETVPAPTREQLVDALSQRIQAVDKRMGRVSVAGPNVLIDVDIEERLRAWNYIFVGASSIKAFGQAVHAGRVSLPPQTEFIIARMTVPTVDRLGNEDRSPILSMRLSVADLEAANFDNLYEAQVMNLGDQVRSIGPIGSELATAYCEDSGTDAATFCRAVLSAS